VNDKAQRYIKRDQRRKWNDNRERLRDMKPEDREREEWEALHALARGEVKTVTPVKPVITI
jgi:hypothetical protein